MSPTQLLFIFLATTIILFITIITVLNLWLYVIIGAIVTAVGIGFTMYYREKWRKEEIMVRGWYEDWKRERYRDRFSSATPRFATADNKADAELRHRIKEEWDRFDREDLR